MGEQRYTAEQLIDAAKQTGGNKSAAGRLLGCDRRTIQRYCDRYVTVNQAFQDAIEAMIDYAESGLRDAVISRQEAWAIKFTLKTIGKDRGYTERSEQEISGPGGAAIQISGLDDTLKRVYRDEDNGDEGT